MPEPFAGSGANPTGPGGAGGISLEENADRPYERRLDPLAALDHGRPASNPPGVALRAFDGTEMGFENDTRNHHFRVTLRFGADEEYD